MDAAARSTTKCSFTTGAVGNGIGERCANGATSEPQAEPAGVVFGLQDHVERRCLDGNQADVIASFTVFAVRVDCGETLYMRRSSDADGTMNDHQEAMS